MKKLTCTLLVAMITMVTMTFAQIIGGGDNPVFLKPEFVIKNTITDETISVELKAFSSAPAEGYTVNLSKGVYAGEELEITYKSLPSIYTHYVEWSYGVGAANIKSQQTTFTATFFAQKPPLSSQNFVVACKSYLEGQSANAKTYTMLFPVRAGNRVTAKNVNASEVQVSYEDYEKVSSTGQRATIALYDIYGNPVSTGYLDNLGMGTLSTKGKSGIYIVKVIMNNQVIFNQRIQVK